MLDQPTIIAPPAIQQLHPPCDEYCTVVFRLQGGRSAMGWFLAELSRHFEGSGTTEVVKFEVGDHLRNRR
ncbi:hypothetical protein PSH66_11165 [Pseudomonas sp. FP597]|uniref:Uncharacterized protein n=1 Tax=Pseudomonas lactucae TaxID=2813360 RepID=A0A9X0YBZ4_9PSED|nr:MULTISPECIES: hypothetical protein [Pseudomonas]MBN2977129.1 hypothetical protein [Pseudomonas lactucae]MBN2988220.1 hypothetical protein [Pseudomonas lactucae]WLI08851.1 hypothetical protein PSH66_11165 [Pseudomonas sp. FP597]